MTAKQISLVKASFEKIRRVGEEAAVLFYARLFELDPRLRDLFKIDIREQGHKLMDMLDVTVTSLDRFDELIPVVRELGIRHAGYGVGPADYDSVKDALLWTFDKALDTDFTAEMREAWSVVYDLLANTMKDAAGQKNK